MERDEFPQPEIIKIDLIDLYIRHFGKQCWVLQTLYTSEFGFFFKSIDHHKVEIKLTTVINFKVKVQCGTNPND